MITIRKFKTSKPDGRLPYGLQVIRFYVACAIIGLPSYFLVGAALDAAGLKWNWVFALCFATSAAILIAVVQAVRYRRSRNNSAGDAE